MTDKFEKDINVPSKQIVDPCNNCNVEPPAMKFKCPTCEHNTEKSIDKIIIDGVDVNGCRCYNQNIKMDCLLYPLQPDACNKNPNCYYKQLKREQTLNKVNLQRSIDLNKELNNLQTELQAEKEKVKELEEKYKDYKQSGSELAKNLVFEAKRTEKYKQALEAIRMIAGSNLCDDDCDECPSNCECDWKDVTDKIDEVLKCKI